MRMISFDKHLAVSSAAQQMVDRDSGAIVQVWCGKNVPTSECSKRSDTTSCRRCGVAAGFSQITPDHWRKR